MHEQHGFLFLDHVPFFQNLPAHEASTVFGGLLLIASTLVVRSKLASAMHSESAIIPDGKLTFKNFFEMIAERLFSLSELILGEEEAPHYYPVVGFLFVFIFFSNLLGLIPGFQPSTDNMNTTLALGVFVFLYYNFVGFKVHGLSYLKHFMGPLLWLAPLMLVIEAASHLFRPLSLALRLRGNILGDHIVLQVFSGLVPYLLPVIFYGLGVFVAFMQAFVFCLMTMVYISLSTSHDH